MSFTKISQKVDQKRPKIKILFFLLLKQLSDRCAPMAELTSCDLFAQSTKTTKTRKTTSKLFRDR